MHTRDTEVGTPMDADNVRPDFRLALELVGGPVATVTDTAGEFSVWLRVAGGHCNRDSYRGVQEPSDTGRLAP
jgi:hypothetical protein